MKTYTQLLNTKQFKQALEHAEREIYLKAHGYTGFNQAATARLLGVARGTVITKLRQFHSNE